MAVVTPAFVSDCLETLEEIGMEAVEDFEENGGDAQLQQRAWACESSAEKLSVLHWRDCKRRCQRNRGRAQQARKT